MERHEGHITKTLYSNVGCRSTENRDGRSRDRRRFDFDTTTQSPIFSFLGQQTPVYGFRYNGGRNLETTAGFPFNLFVPSTTPPPPFPMNIFQPTQSFSFNPNPNNMFGQGYQPAIPPASMFFPQNQDSNNFMGLNFGTTAGFPFNLFSPESPSTTPVPFPLNLFQPATTQTYAFSPLNSIFPTTQKPFPFNLFS